MGENGAKLELLRTCFGKYILEQAELGVAECHGEEHP